MNHANGKTVPHILPPMHPVRITRPDNVRRKWLITSLPGERIQVTRHWNKELGCTEVCKCQPVCMTSREDYFTGALLFIGGAENGKQAMEQVVLHCTEQTVRSIYTALRIKHDDGDMAGVVVALQRVGGGSGRVQVVAVERAALTDNRPKIDVAGVVLSRLRMSADFFGRRFDDNEELVSENQVIPPARSRSDKPRVPKGK